MAFTKSTADLANISKLDDEPNDVGGLSAAELKAEFDAAAGTLQSFVNSHITELESSTAAGNVGALAVDGATASTVQAVIVALKTLIDACETQASATASFALKEDKTVTAQHYKAVTFDTNTGIFTFTRENGSTTSIDTALEKVATNWAYDAATQSLVLTLADGSTQSISLSAFITENEYLDSDTLDFSVSDHKITAIVKDGSITDTKLASALKTTLQNYVTQAANSAYNASSSETNALNYKYGAEYAQGGAVNAKTAAETAQAAAEAAQEDAEVSASNAATSETNAKTSETNALNYKNAANTSATNASTSEANALASKNAAASSASAASTSETNAANSAAQAVANAGVMAAVGNGFAIANGSTRPALGLRAVDESYTTDNTKGATGDKSHAEGQYTTASGAVAHAEGFHATASGEGAHAEGYYTQATGDYSHAEDLFAVASGYYSHAEGRGATASGKSSHAEGYNTIAAGENQHVSGTYNIADTTSLEIIGNGIEGALSNARTLDQQGNAWYAGKVSAGTVATPATPTAANDLTPKQYVDALVNANSASISELTNSTVKFSAEQVLTTAQRLQARTNIGAAPIIGIADAYELQAAVRSGYASSILSVGDFFTVGINGSNWLFQAAAFDYDVPVNPNFTHSLRLLMYPCFANVVLDSSEAIYYATAELPAGTYWFINNRTSKYYSFATTQAIPAGGQVVPVFGASPDYVITQVKTYASQVSTTALETATATISNIAPTTGVQLTPVNDDNRSRWGSNNWTQSAMRKWLNSSAASGWWTPSNNYDRPQLSPTAGFLYNIDPDLLACIGQVRLRTGINPFDNSGTYGSADNAEKVFLPSRFEVGLGFQSPVYEAPVANDGTVKTTTMPLFTDNASRIKYLDTTARYWWLRSPYPYASTANRSYLVSPAGVLDFSDAYSAYAAVPACAII